MTRTTSSIAVLGAGSWGTALAILLARNGHDVRLWGHLQSEVEPLNADRENRQFLPGVTFPDRLSVGHRLDHALEGAQHVLVVVPSHAFRSVLESLHPLITPGTGLAWGTKGLEPGTGRLLHEVVGDVLGEWPMAVISGPTFAKEVSRGLPTAITVAANSDEHGNRVADLLQADYFRAYTSRDIIGVEVGGASKNVLAIAAGIADGLGFGANSRAALITRGLAELMRLGQALGGQAETFMGLAGLGDLALTCTDNQSRNRRMGLAIARGLSIAEARVEIGQEVEGVQAAQAVYNIAQDLGVEMPISKQTYRVLFEGLEPREAASELFHRTLKREFD